MYNKKICILGERGVGKSCLLQRFLNGSFDDGYEVTIGANIRKAQLQVDTAGAPPRRVRLRDLFAAR